MEEREKNCIARLAREAHHRIKTGIRVRMQSVCRDCPYRAACDSNQLLRVNAALRQQCGITLQFAHSSERALKESIRRKRGIQNHRKAKMRIALPAYAHKKNHL